MASELHVDAIKHSGGTSAITINSSGHVHSAGAVLQVVEGTLVSTSQFTTTSTSLADTGLTLQITPKFNTSKILVSMIGFGGSGGDNCALLLQIQRQIGSGSFTMINGGGFFYEVNNFEGCCLSKLDAPNTTSTLTYKVQGHLSTASGTGYFPGNWANEYASTGMNTLTAQEIAQ
jgi:hypothetical protein